MLGGMDDEMLDIVDGFDTVIGTVNRKDYTTFLEQKQGYIRAAELFIMNQAGELWIPVRTADKTIVPNGFDYSAGGHVGAGEGYLETIIRETKEETNLDVAAANLEFVAKLKSESIRYIRSLYLLRSEETPHFNPHDFVSAEWLKPTELIARIDAGHPTKTNLRNAVTVLQLYLSGS